MRDDLSGRLAACPHCSARLRILPEHVGQLIGCPRCGRAIGPAPLVGSGSSSGEFPAGALPAPEAPGHVETTCPDCGAGLRVRARYLGRHVRCGGCNGKFRVESATASALDAPAPPADHGPAPTPDPDDPGQGRAEVMRLLDEIAELKAVNARLVAEAERLERERDAALRDLARLRQDRGRPAIPFDHGEAAPFPYLKDAAGASGG
ncbi:MAG: hypothetical protein BGO49_21200 [Planctomycetales bacterium 71-10]|nr:MAG: hypothetical protein BGO49_21200 [Planctomycetales bacterium 71-10]